MWVLLPGYRCLIDFRQHAPSCADQETCSVATPETEWRVHTVTLYQTTRASRPEVPDLEEDFVGQEVQKGCLVQPRHCAPSEPVDGHGPSSASRSELRKASKLGPRQRRVMRACCHDMACQQGKLQPLRGRHGDRPLAGISPSIQCTLDNACKSAAPLLIKASSKSVASTACDLELPV